MSEEKFSKCEEGEKSVSVEFRVFGKKKEKFRGKKIKVFWVEIKVKVAICLRKFKIRDFYLLGSYPLVGRHVVNESKVRCYVVNELEIF